MLKFAQYSAKMLLTYEYNYVIKRFIYQSKHEVFLDEVQPKISVLPGADSHMSP